MTLIEDTWEDYFDKIPASKLHNGIESSEGPSPYMASLKGLRIAVADELPKNIPLKTSIIKAMTSDTLKARFLNQNPIKIKPLYTLVMISNDHPPFDEVNSGPMETRLGCIEFGNVFDEKAPDDPAEQERTGHYKADPNFIGGVRKYSSALIYEAARRYKDLLKKGLRKMPKKMREYTQKYWDDKDYFKKFLVEKVKDTKSQKHKVSLHELYDEFKDWCREMRPGTRIVNGDAFELEVIRIWSKPNEGKSWTGKRLLSD